MKDATPPPTIIVPGWGGSGPEHWQTLWAAELGATRVELADWQAPEREAWLAGLDDAVARAAGRDPRPPVLVAHSLGCIAVAAWARAAARPIRAALLVAPADVERDGLPVFRAFQPVPRAALPFRSLVAASDDDPYITAERARELAGAWRSELHVIRAGGHLNAASKLGRWPHGRALLRAVADVPAAALTEMCPV